MKFTLPLCLLLAAVPSGRCGEFLKFQFAIEGYQTDDRFNEPLSVHFNPRRQEIFVSDTGNHRVDVFSRNGTPLIQFFARRAEVQYPVCAMTNSRGELIVSEMNSSRVKVFDFKGKYLKDLSLKDVVASSEPVAPGRFALDAEDNLYLLDRANARVHVFDAEGKYKLSFGDKGRKDGELWMPADIAVDPAGMVYVSDSISVPVQVFDRSGKYVRGFGKHGQGKTEFSFPSGIALDRKNRVWVADSFRHDLKVFDVSGAFLASHDGVGQDEATLLFPVDLDFDEDNRVLVLEKGANRLKVFSVEKK
ncbi:MAG: 6-bladed beta-propeller [Elusimicrobia bacterium]|nr:6-bladed beta-propeller [Elusimicrobiota bacterium]